MPGLQRRAWRHLGFDDQVMPQFANFSFAAGLNAESR
jgi:hypothetical protein